MKKYSLAIVGATGVVGRCILKKLEEEKLPIRKYYLFASKNSKGKKIKFMNKIYKIDELTEKSFNKHIDFAIFSAGSEVAKKFAPIAAEHGTIVIDNSNAFRMNPVVPLVVPEVNSNEIIKNNGIISNPNCSTIQAVVALKPLDEKYKIKRIVYSTYQAVSGAGRNGIIDLKNGIDDFEYQNENVDSNIVKSSNYELSKFDYPIFNNCLPHIDVFEENGYTREETKMINETRKILARPNLPITATCVRVPVFNSHSESINVEFENDFKMEDLLNTLENADGIVLSRENDKYPIATKVSGNDKVYVGRVRRDFSVKSGINFWCVADNIRKGAATNAVQILKKLI